MKAKTVAEVMAGEANSFDDLEMIASVVVNRANLAGATLDSIIAAPGQFDAYNKSLPKGVGRRQVARAQAILDRVVQDGVPAQYQGAIGYARDYAVGGLPRDWAPTGVVTPDRHVVFSDPSNGWIATTAGYVPPRMELPSAQQASAVTPSLGSLGGGLVDYARTGPAGLAYGDLVPARGVSTSPVRAPGPGLAALAPNGLKSGALPAGLDMVDGFRARLSSVNFDDFPLDPATRERAKAFQQQAGELGLDLAVDVKDMTRTPERQKEIKNAGYSRTSLSEHMYGGAIDVSPVDVNDQEGWAAKRSLASDLGWDQLGSWDPAHMGVTKPAGITKREAYNAFNAFGSVPALQAGGIPTPTARPDLVPPGMEVARAALPDVEVAKSGFAPGLQPASLTPDNAGMSLADALGYEETAAPSTPSSAARSIAATDTAAPGLSPREWGDFARSLPDTGAVQQLGPTETLRPSVTTERVSPLGATESIVGQEMDLPSALTTGSPLGAPQSFSPIGPQHSTLGATASPAAPASQPTISPKSPINPDAPMAGTITQADDFPAAPEEAKKKTDIAGAMKRAAAGFAMGGFPGAAIGLASGLLGDRMGMGSIFGAQSGMVPQAERFNAGYGIPGIEAGMYGARGATGYSRSNPGAFTVSRGPGLGYDLTNSLGAVTHYDSQGHITATPNSGIGLGGLFGGLFGGGSRGGISQAERDRFSGKAGLF